jgi:hypothetical protein
MRLQNCWGLTRGPLTGTWYRAVSTAHLATPLAYAQTATRSGRFHSGTVQRPGMAVLYLTEDPLTAQFEGRYWSARPSPEVPTPRIPPPTRRVGQYFP